VIEPSNLVWTNAITGEFSSAQTGSDVLRLKKGSPSKHWPKSYLFPNCSLLINKSFLDLALLIHRQKTDADIILGQYSTYITCIAYPLDAGLCDAPDPWRSKLALG